VTGHPQRPAALEQANGVRYAAATPKRLRIDPTAQEGIDALMQMTATERQAALRRGDLSRRQCWAWVQRHPDEVPLINGEWFFIAAHTPEAAD